MESITLSEDVGEQDGSKIQAIDFVILAEFDIDTGSTIRHQYPREVPGYTADYFANYMLPEVRKLSRYRFIVLFCHIYICVCVCVCVCLYHG